MNSNILLLCLFGILALFSTGTVAREAIVGGEIADLSPFRYMVSLLEVGVGHICGGTIVSELSILTAAHCFVNPDNSFKNQRVAALMGTKNLLHYNRPAVYREVSKVYVLKEYNATDLSTTADLAVLRLIEPLYIGNHKNLRMIKFERNQQENHDGEKATFAGWGWNLVNFQNNQFVGLRTDPQLRFAKADILTNHQCQLEHPALQISEDHLCARIEQHPHETRGTCYGDDGGALVHDGAIIGVLSKFITGCTERSSSAIYTRVSHYLTFIRNAKIDQVTKNMRAHIL